MKYKLKSKGVYYTIKKTKKEYAQIKRITSSNAPMPTLDTNTTSSFKLLSRTQDKTKADKYDQDQNKVLYFIVIALLYDD